MTSFQEPGTSKPWFFSSVAKPLGLLALAYLVQGAFVGMTDDEAYYWVLSQRPALGYAYHPPMVAWMIALTRLLLGWAIPAGSALLVRIPAIACMIGFLTLSLRWLERAGVPPARLRGSLLTLLSFGGMFALAWMMVPDLPLLLGWSLAFLGSWEYTTGNSARRPGGWKITLGIALAILSKFSGGLVALSAALSILFISTTSWKLRLRALIWPAAGFLLAAAPILFWNYQHEWGSLLYQFHDRHSGASANWVRFGRFWLVQLGVAGVPLVYFALRFLFRGVRLARPADASADEARMLRFVWLWTAPAALIFCVQPLFSDFKIHWAYVVWWPALLAFAWLAAQGRLSPWLSRGMHRFQVGYGLSLVALVWLACQVPLCSWALRAVQGETFDTRLDVTNDLSGWREFGAWVAPYRVGSDHDTPFIGSWYQTASQAAFALGDSDRVSLVPRDLKSRDEWPLLQQVTSLGPDWPMLHGPVFYVSDNRYADPPAFHGAHCVEVAQLKAVRFGLPAKRIELWRCQP